MAGRSQGVFLSFLYWSLRRLLELVVLCFRSEREKEIEILLLRLWVPEIEISSGQTIEDAPRELGFVLPLRRDLVYARARVAK